MTAFPGNPLLASIALEPNRWKSPAARMPSLRVSEWSDRARAAGFAGWELWENHFFMADPAEQAALRDSTLPVRIFNTYLLPGTDPDSAWERVAAAVRFLGPQVAGIKFNLGGDAVPLAGQLAAAGSWSATLPAGVRMLCECHGGTVLESPEAAATAFHSWPADRFAAILHPMNGGPAHIDAWFNALGPRIRHLHWQARGPDNRVRPLAQPPQPLAAAIARLNHHRFAGSHSIEFVHGTSTPADHPAALFAAAAADALALHAIIKA